VLKTRTWGNVNLFWKKEEKRKLIC
jgi:hypothetical protein